MLKQIVPHPALAQITYLLSPPCNAPLNNKLYYCTSVSRPPSIFQNELLSGTNSCCFADRCSRISKVHRCPATPPPHGATSPCTLRAQNPRTRILRRRGPRSSNPSLSLSGVRKRLMRVSRFSLTCTIAFPLCSCFLLLSGTLDSLSACNLHGMPQPAIVAIVLLAKRACAVVIRLV